jgi:hypothetical protein
MAIIRKKASNDVKKYNIFRQLWNRVWGIK